MATWDKIKKDKIYRDCIQTEAEEAIKSPEDYGEDVTYSSFRFINNQVDDYVVQIIAEQKKFRKKAEQNSLLNDPDFEEDHKKLRSWYIKNIIDWTK